MAGSRQILQRRSAAANISKVAHTMETISAVRYQQYYRRWSESLEFYDFLAQIAYLIATAKTPIEHPLLAGNGSKTGVLLVIGSRRGLCGSYNSNLNKLIDVHLNMARRFKRKLRVFAKGRKVVNYLRSRDVEIERVLDEFDEVPSTEQCRELGEFFLHEYLEGRIARFSVVYSRFFNIAHQQAQTLAILPVSDLIDDLTTRSTVIWPWDLQFEDFILSPSAIEIFESLAHMIVYTDLLGCFVEAALSEHLARVVAMRNATDNADQMIKDLTREYNRARQGQITVELLDIIAGVQSAGQE